MKKRCVLFISLLIIFIYSCNESSETPPEPEKYVSFKVDGLLKKYSFSSTFSKTGCADATYCNIFTAKKDSTGSEAFKLGVPGEPIVGKVYKTGDQNFSCYYTNRTGISYFIGSQPFQVTFNLWEGQGGWASGTFSGWLYSPEGDSVEIRNGTFQDQIWSY
jgi:hypothetical protein